MAQSSTYKIAVKIAGSVEKSFNSAFKNANKHIASIAKVSAAATAAAATALVGLGAAAIKAGVEYESAFAGVKKTVDATQEQLDALDKGIRDMARTMPTSAVEIAGVAEAAGQLGIQTDNILSFTKVMTQLGDATNLTADEAATTLARFANITGMSQKDFDRLGATIVDLGNNYATTEAEITAMGLRLAAAGNQVGMSESEILGFATALSSVGLEAEAGGSAMSKLMVKIQLATEGGGKALKQYAKVAGVSTSEFKKSFQTDAAGAIIQFLSGLNDTKRLGKSAIAILDDMGLSEIRLRDTILRSANASGMMKGAIERSNTAWKENTALTKEVEQRYATMESQFNILKNGLTNLGIEFYQSVRNPLADILKEANNAVDTLTTAFQEGGLDGLTASLGTVLAGGVQMIADYAPDIVDAGVNMVKNFVNGINENSEQIASSAAVAGGKFVQGMLSIAPSLLLTAGQLIINFANGIAQQAPMLIQSAVVAIIQFWQGIASMLPTISQSAVMLLLALAQGIVSNLPMILQCGAQVILQLIDGILQSVPLIASGAMQVIQCLLIGILSNLGDIIEAGITIITSLAGGLIQAIPEIIKGAAQIVIAIVNTLINTDWGKVAKEVVKGIGNGLKNGVKSIGKGLKSWILGKDDAEELKNAGKSTLDSYASGIQSNYSVVTNATNGIGTSAQLVGLTAGQDFTRGFTTGINPTEIAAVTGSAISAAKSAGTNSSAQLVGLTAGQDFTRGFTTGIDPTEIAAVTGSAISAAKSAGTNSSAQLVGLTAGQDFTRGFTTGIDPTEIATVTGNAISAAKSAGTNSSAQLVGLTAGQDFTRGFTTGIDPTEIATVTGSAISAAKSAGTNSSAQLVGLTAGQDFTRGFTTGIDPTEIATVTGSAISAAKSAETNSAVQLAGQTAGQAFTTGFASSAGTVDMTQFNTAVKTTGNQTVQAFDSSWQTVQNKANTAMNNLKNTVVSAAKSTASQVKSAFENMTITIPRPKLPVISTSYKTESYGKGGNVKIPSFNVSWNAAGGIFKRPTIFNTASAGMQGVGEAGAEAILPLDLLWKKMSSIVSQSIKNNQNQSIFDTLLRRLSTNQSSGGNGKYQLAGADGFNISYSPQYNLYGTAGKNEIAEADKMSRAEFDKMMKQWQKDNRRKKF